VSGDEQPIIVSYNDEEVKTNVKFSGLLPDEEDKEESDEGENKKKKKKLKRKVSFHESTNENEKDHKDNIPLPGGHPIKLDDVDEWAYKANKKDKNQKKKLKGGSSRGHEKILDDMHKAYNEKKQKEK